MRETERLNWASGTKRRTHSAATVAISVVFLLLLSAALGLLFAGGARAYNPLPNGLGQAAIEPNPSEEGNVTISSHASGWGALEYGTSGAPTNLSAHLDARVMNPLQVNPTDVIAPGILQAEKVGGTYWNATSDWGALGGTLFGATKSGPTLVTVNAQPAIQWTINETAAHALALSTLSLAIASSNFPSTNPAFNFATMGIQVTGPACASGCSFTEEVTNASAAGGGTSSQPVVYSTTNGQIVPCGSAGSTPVKLTAPGSEYYSSSFSQMSSTANLGLNASGAGATTAFQFELVVGLPAGAAGTFTITATDVALGTTPNTLGSTLWHYKLAGATTATNNSIGRQAIIGSDNLTTLQPTFAYTSVVAGGYQAAIVQRASDLPAANSTISFVAINTANATTGGPSYTEQLSYTFTFGLPVAAALSYGTFKLIDIENISGSQYVTVAFAGTSYTAAYQAYATCTMTPTCSGMQKIQTVQSSVSPTVASVWFGVVDYTGTQWDVISAAPSIFSSAGFEYYWFVFLGLILAVVGLGSGWVVNQQRAQKIRSPRGVGRLPFSQNRQGMGAHHHAAWILGVLLIVAGVGAIWAVFAGADTNGAAAAFIGTLIIAAIIFAIAFVAYEVSSRRRRGRRSGI